MSDLRDGDDCCDEKSPLVRPPPLLFSTPREEGGEEKSRGAFATGSFSGWTECSVAPRL